MEESGNVTGAAAFPKRLVPLIATGKVPGELYLTFLPSPCAGVSLPTFRVPETGTDGPPLRLAVPPYRTTH